LEDVQPITIVLKEFFHILLIVSNENFEEVSIECFEAISSVRFYLLKFAELFDLCNDQLSLSEAECELLDQVKILCTNQKLNKKVDSKVIGPGAYFLKLFVQMYGFSNLLKASKLYEWIIPEVVLPPDQVYMNNQYFLSFDNIDIPYFYNSQKFWIHSLFMIP